MYSVWLLISYCTVTPYIGLIWGHQTTILSFGYMKRTNSSFRLNHLFSTLAFFIASAAYRAFRIRNVESTILPSSGFYSLLGNVSTG